MLPPRPMTLLALTWIVSTFFAEHPAEAAPRLYALVLAKGLAADSEIARRIELLADDVERAAGFTAVWCTLDDDVAPEELRTEVQRLVKAERIQGALLVGGFRFQRFKNAVGEVATFPEYFEDLDGEFRDDDHDGLLDFYDPWSRDKDDDALEIWVAALRPYEDEGPPTLASYLDKLHEARSADPPPARATIFSSKDWAHQEDLLGALERLYGVPAALYGGFERGQAVATSPAEFRQAAAESGRLLFVFAHSSPSRHHLDQPAGPAGQIVPFERESPEQVLVEDLELGARAIMIWGCHGLDLEGIDYPKGRFLANSYCLTRGSACETVLGSGRSIGMESLETFVRGLRDAPLPVAWLAYMNHLYRKSYLSDWLGVRDAWEKERCRFNWSYLLYGNPFVDLGPGKMQGKTKAK